MFSASIFSAGLVLLPFVSAAIHDVQVGSGGLSFSPEAISAEVGDQIVFHFVAKNHTVTQSSFASPCSLKDGGFDSGFMPVAANQTDNFPTYTVVVNTTDPVWVFCRQAADTPASHCGQGMIFSANCPPDGSPNSFDNFKQEALAIGASLSSAAAASATPAASATATAASGDITAPPAADPTLVTQPITLESSTWTTTYSSFPGSPAPTPASLDGDVIKVVVGGSSGQLTFSPSRVDAKPRDTIMFEFQQKNHSIVQSTFTSPCLPMNVNGTTGFKSDFFPVPDNSTDFPTFNVTVNDTAPIWVYCRQQTPKSHCGAGMVFAVNSVEAGPKNFSAFQSVAEQQNGTSSASSSAPSTSATGSSNGGVSVRVGSAGVSLVIAAFAASFL